VALHTPVADTEGNIIPLVAAKKHTLPPVGHLWEAVGCDECNGQGYSGRTGVYEVLEINEDIRRLAIRNADASEIKKCAVDQGMRSLRDDGAHKVLCGTTSLDEVMRVTSEET